MAKKSTKRKFSKVPKTKGGVPKKYVRGSKNPRKAEAEIKRTARLYKQGKLTPAMMNKISKQRAKDGRRKKRKNKK
tara:strand:+ start:1373 stop:1600 length:228 start_codon:yes stop_codon:yes gene_type:complete